MSGYEHTSGPPTLVGTGIDKTGREIRAFLSLNTDRPNRGFMSHTVTVHHEDEKLGYLRADYVDTGAYEFFNPTIWNHLGNFSGYCGLFGERPVDPRTLCGEEAAKFRTGMLHHLGMYNAPDPGSYAAFEKVAKTLRRYKEAVQERERFFDFHLEKPYVGYVCTDVAPIHGVTRDSRGLGLGKILYAATAHAMDGLGLPFHASGLQSESAKRVWADMEEKGWTSEVPVMSDSRRVRLYADRIPESVFRRAELENEPSPF